MPRPHPIGVRRETIPIPPVEEDLVRVPAGAVEFGVEYRRLNEDIIAAHLAEHPGTADEVARARRLNATEGVAIDEKGASIHVFDRVSGQEFLRFDLFGNDPHYHYITPGRHHLDVGFDETASGDFLAWVLAALRLRLADMLALAGGSELAAAVDPSVLEAALATVETLAVEAVEGHRAVGAWGPDSSVQPIS